MAEIQLSKQKIEHEKMLKKLDFILNEFNTIIFNLNSNFKEISEQGNQLFIKAMREKNKTKSNLLYQEYYKLEALWHYYSWLHKDYNKAIDALYNLHSSLSNTTPENIYEQEQKNRELMKPS